MTDLNVPDTPLWREHGRIDQRHRLFRIYNQYRVVVSVILVGLLFVEVDIGSRQQFFLADYYQASVVAYLALNCFTGLVMITGFRPNQQHITLSILLDILMMHALLFFSSGITSGLANLVIVSVAAGNILTPSRMGLFYAALATLCSLGIASWAALVQDADLDGIVRAGSLGILYFAAAFVLQNITRRMLRSEALASSRARSIVELEQINQQIIERMRTGILVTDMHGQIRLANAAAEELLFGETTHNTGINARRFPLPEPLQKRLETWQADPEQRGEPFQPGPLSPMLQANFTRLHQGRGDLILVFVEDMSKVTQQAQQMKLASLGRLTAGIAHEVRNPLGAISHAAQLMAESKELNATDRPMLDIIQRHSRRVNNIIENVLDLSRRAPAESDMVEVGPWLEDFVSEYRQSLLGGPLDQSTIRLQTEPGLPPARFDRSQIEQVLVNLCDNGLRYSARTSDRPEITIQAGATADGERVYLDVRDEGPGISEEHRSSVFEPFFTTDKSGTGLGLYLARELCESNQAHLSLLDDDQPGCCFRITFAHYGRLI